MELLIRGCHFEKFSKWLLPTNFGFCFISFPFRTKTNTFFVHAVWIPFTQRLQFKMYETKIFIRVRIKNNIWGHLNILFFPLLICPLIALSWWIFGYTFERRDFICVISSNHFINSFNNIILVACRRFRPTSLRAPNILHYIYENMSNTD